MTNRIDVAAGEYNCIKALAITIITHCYVPHKFRYDLGNVWRGGGFFAFEIMYRYDESNPEEDRVVGWVCICDDKVLLRPSPILETWNQFGMHTGNDDVGLEEDIYIGEPKLYYYIMEWYVKLYSMVIGWDKTAREINIETSYHTKYNIWPKEGGMPVGVIELSDKKLQWR